MQGLEGRKKKTRWPKTPAFLGLAFVLLGMPPGALADGDRVPEIDVGPYFCHGTLCEPCNTPGFRVMFIDYTLYVARVLPENLLQVDDPTKLTYGVFVDLGWEGSYHKYEIVSGLSWEYDFCEPGVLNRYGTHGLFADVAGIP